MYVVDGGGEMRDSGWWHPLVAGSGLAGLFWLSKAGSELVPEIKCAVVAGCLFFIVLAFNLNGVSRQKYAPPSAVVIDGFTVLVVGDTSSLSMTPGVISKEHIGDRKWLFHIRTTHSHPEWHDEAQDVVDYINSAESHRGM